MSDLCQHIFVKHNVTGLRRLKKTDTNRIARATGATVVNRTDEIKESDIGTGAGVFYVDKIGDEYAPSVCFFASPLSASSCDEQQNTFVLPRHLLPCGKLTF